MLTGLQRMYRQQECVGTKTSIEANAKDADRASPPQSRIHPCRLCENRAEEGDKTSSLFLHAIVLRLKRQ